LIKTRPVKKRGTSKAPKSSGPTIAVRTPNVKGSSRPVDAAKYRAMKTVLLKVLPKKQPGMTDAEMMTAVGKAAPKDTFPRTTFRWWAKCVQLDLEARGELVREKVTPLRRHVV
jgi:uncharacterized protein DUF6958